MTAKVEITACNRPLKVSTHKVYTRPDNTVCATSDQFLIKYGETHTLYPYTSDDGSFSITGIVELSAEEAGKVYAPDPNDLFSATKENLRANSAKEHERFEAAREKRLGAATRDLAKGERKEDYLRCKGQSGPGLSSD